MKDIELNKRSRWQPLYYLIALYANACVLTAQGAQDAPIQTSGKAPAIGQSLKKKRQKRTSRPIKKLNAKLLQAVKENDANKVQQLLKKITSPQPDVVKQTLEQLIANKIDANVYGPIFKKLESENQAPVFIYSLLKNTLALHIPKRSSNTFKQSLIWEEAHRKTFLKALTAYASSSIKNAQKTIDLAIKNKHYYLLYPLLEIYRQFEQTEEASQWICQKIKELKISADAFPSFASSFKMNQQLYADAAMYFVGTQDETPKHIASKYGNIPIIWLTTGKESNPQQKLSFNCPETIQILAYTDSIDPTYGELFSAIQLDSLIIASNNVTCKLLASVYNNMPASLSQWEKFKDRVKNDWLLYRVHNSQYCVWVPASHSAQYLDLLNLDNLILVKDAGSNNLDRNNLPCPTPISDQQPLESTHPYTKSDPAKIFKPKNLYQNSKNKMSILDFYIAGHGAAGVLAACIPIERNKPEQERLTSLLTYLNDNLSAGTVTITTCSAGGLSRSLFTQTASGVPIRYSYNLIIEASSDKPTATNNADSYARLRKYFANADRLAAGKITIDKLCYDLRYLNPTKQDAHGSANIAQVLLPGMHEFIGCDSNIVFQASQDTMKSNALIEIKNKQAALWYVNDVPQTVRVYPNQPKTLPPATALPPLPLSSDMTQTAPLVYPEFIPMDRGTNTLHFNHIVVDSDNNSGGILHFIRDAFLDISQGPSPLAIFIDRLDGLNDIITPIQAGISEMVEEKPGDVKKKIEHWKAALNTQTSLHNVAIFFLSKKGDPKSRMAFMYFPLTKDDEKTLRYQVTLAYSDTPTEAGAPWRALIVPTAMTPSLYDMPQVPLTSIERTFRMLKQSGISQKQHEQAFDDFAEDAINTALSQMKDMHGESITLPNTIDPSKIRNDAPNKRGYAAFKQTVPPEKLDEIVNQFNYLFQKALAAASEKSRPATLKAITDKAQLNRELHDLQFKKLIQTIENDDSDMVGKLLDTIEFSSLSEENREELYRNLQGKPNISYAILDYAISKQDIKTIEDIITHDKVSFRFSEHSPSPLLKKAKELAHDMYTQYVYQKLSELMKKAPITASQ